jgi:hypothetical protein
MSFNTGPSLGASTPFQQSKNPLLYPSLNSQTPSTPGPTGQGPPFSQNPPPRPASVPLTFGGGVSHSSSTPSFPGFQDQSSSLQSQQTSQSFSQSFSPAPQTPLTTYDLGRNSPFTKQSLPWGQTALGGHSLTRSHSQQFMPIGNPLGERRYLPSHLRVFRNS